MICCPLTNVPPRLALSERRKTAAVDLDLTLNPRDVRIVQLSRGRFAPAEDQRLAVG